MYIATIILICIIVIISVIESKRAAAVEIELAAEKKRKAQHVDTYLDLSEVPTGVAPANITTRDPYHALEFLPPGSGELSDINACACRAMETTTAIEKTGNYRQITNNYKRGSPDSCSTGAEDFLLSFYGTKPINVVPT